MNSEDGFCVSHGNLSSAPWKSIGSLPHRILEVGSPQGQADQSTSCAPSRHSSALAPTLLSWLPFTNSAPLSFTCLGPVDTTSLPYSSVLCLPHLYSSPLFFPDQHKCGPFLGCAGYPGLISPIGWPGCVGEQMGTGK
jgi:hypothetical protein